MRLLTQIPWASRVGVGFDPEGVGSHPVDDIHPA